MLSKRFAGVCILALTFSFLTVYAHQAPDPGPSIIKGNIANMNNLPGAQIGYDTNSWSLTDSAPDSQGNAMLSVGISLDKQRYYNPDGTYYATGGTAYAGADAAATVSGLDTRGDYYIKAKARGLLWFRSDKLSSSYRKGTYKSVSKGAARTDNNPTWSGVHLWGKAKIDNQFDDVEIIFEWL